MIPICTRPQKRAEQLGYSSNRVANSSLDSFLKYLNLPSYPTVLEDMEVVDYYEITPELDQIIHRYFS